MKRNVASAARWVMGGLLAISMAAVASGPNQAVSTSEGSRQSATGDPAAAARNLAAAQRHAAIVNQLTDQLQGDAASQFAGGFNPLDWRLQFGSRLFLQSPSTLLSAMSVNSISALNDKLAVAPKHLGGIPSAITLLSNPCRIVDTRFGGGGQLGPSPRLWYAFNTPAIIGGQGGNPAGCGSFPDAELFLVYVTVVPPGTPLAGGAQFLTLQHDSSVPTVATMNFYAGVNIANFATPACFNCAGTSTGGFHAYASSLTHVVIDLVGVAGPIPHRTLWASLNADGTTDRGLGVTSSLKLGGFTGAYEIIFNRNVTGCGYQATIGNPTSGTAASGQISVQQRAFNVNGVFVQTNDSAGTASDRPFYVSVHCQ